MNQNKQRCPYCGKRMTYLSAYFSRRKAEFVCPRCGKESKVVISKIIIPIFIIAVLIALAVMGVWWFLRLLSNPLGILLVAIPLLVFLLISPYFVRLEPMKKYRKSMEAKKAGIEYSDNLTALDFEDNSASADSSGQFRINADIFNQIKSERSSKKEQNGVELVSDSATIDGESYVHIISDVSEDHGSTASYPLKKLHSEGSRKRPPRYELDKELQDNIADDDDVEDGDVKEYIKGSARSFADEDDDVKEYVKGSSVNSAERKQ